MPMVHPEIFSSMGIRPPRGVLLHGPPGCGKTLLAHAIAGELKVPFLQISAPSIVSGMSGESEKKLREIFEEAMRMAPALLFLDEIDAIAPKRETAQREMERRIVAQLLTCLDGNRAAKPLLIFRPCVGEERHEACDCDRRHQPARRPGPCPSSSGAV